MLDGCVNVGDDSGDKEGEGVEEMLILKDILRDNGDSGVHWSRCAGYRGSTYVPWSFER